MTVPHDPLFDSAWLKWAQAILHSQALERDITEGASNGDTDPVRAFRAEYHPKRHGFAVIVEDVAPIPVRWRLLLGDIANNYRASLDHFAWALVSRGSARLTTQQERAVYFPIYEDRLKYNAAFGRLLPGVRRADAARVRWCQPYRHGPSVRSRHPLVILASINTGDKHRTVQPLWAFPSRVDIEVTRMRDCVLRGTEHWRRQATPLEAGTEVAFMFGRKRGSNPELEVQLHIASTPTIGNRISVREWHVRTGILIFSLLRQFSSQPASIHEVGAELAALP